ncbi:MAG: hypothetical protein IPM48_09450 [Saprospiraceae bacterium]|nr:hypothetical protein [Saprospiraceae bacterium]
MKLKFLFFILVAGMGLMATSSCKQESKDKAADTPQVEQPAADQPATQQPNVQMPPDFTPVSGPPQNAPQNAKGVWHFTCPKGCAGGAGAAGPCPKCGEALTHNQAYHEN